MYHNVLLKHAFHVAHKAKSTITFLTHMISFQILFAVAGTLLKVFSID
jgi:hypothetical protein